MCQSALSNGSPRPARLRSNLGKDLSVGVARGAVFGLVLLGLTTCGSASVTGAKEPGSSTTTTVGLSTRPTAPPTTTFSTVNVPTPQQQGIPTVALGTSQEVTKLTDTATITLLKVVDPVAPASSTSTVPASHTVGLDFSVENLTSDPILGISQRHEPSLEFVIYGTSGAAYLGFSGVSPSCTSYAPTTVIPLGGSFTGCEFALLPQGTGVAQVLISLDYGGLGGTSAAWQVA